MLRLWVPSPLAAGQDVSASENQAHYLANVMRRAVGDAVLLFNGQDGEWHARIAQLGRGRGRLTPETLVRAQTAGADLWLAFALLKRDATDLAVRQATELGVAALLPVMTERTNAARINHERLSAIAIEAAEQCERLDVPAIRPPVTLPALLAAWPADRMLAAAIERAGPTASPAGVGALLIGPEGGFAPAEIDALRRTRFVAPICLGPLVLRAETAASAGLALLQAQSWSTR
jgi:16S rRNA (uracil1498-N3)-methyltransferase